MIVFNGISIDSIPGVIVEDVRVSPIRYSPVTRPRAIRWGSEFVRMGGGERTITLSFAVLDRDLLTRKASLDALSQWARTDAEYKMELPTDTAKFLTCVCTQKPEPSTRAWWENKLRLVFTCFSNPYWTSKSTKGDLCGNEINVLGDAPPLMQITRTLSSAASNQTFSNGTQSMTFSTIPSGDLVIDLNAQTAAVGGNSIMQYFQPSGSFVLPKLGKQTITGTGAIVWRERWE